MTLKSSVVRVLVGTLIVVQQRGGRGGVVVGGVTVVIVVLARGISCNTQCLDACLRSSARRFTAATALLLNNFGDVWIDVAAAFVIAFGERCRGSIGGNGACIIIILCIACGVFQD